MKEKYFKAELRSVDAWRNIEGVWYANHSHVLENNCMFLGKDSPTTRCILDALRRWNYLTEASKGRVTVDDTNWPYVEVLVRSTREPIFILYFEEKE